MSVVPTPNLVVHADWGSEPRKRWMATAVRKNGSYQAQSPEPVGNAKTLMGRMRELAGEGGSVLIGFDFPIGVPAAYAERVGVRDFLALLPELGRGEWADFYAVAERPDQIGLRRPFYPQRPGGTSMRHLLEALLMNPEDLLRLCDRRDAERGAASALFWTMGPKQVGKAAIKGWTEVLVPALTSGADDVAVWPFDGELSKLLASDRVVLAETYPAEFYGHLGVALDGSKRSQRARRGVAGTLLSWARTAKVDLTPDMESVIEGGFGPSQDGEDPFDATVGLFGMLEVVLGRRLAGEPDDEKIRKVEGWMLGKA
ncbi:MAG: hypothetical protein M3P49_08120 [Actinomycetota bacterium]|nr:hypothetical protein [Actinomycetota bacterium]